MQAPTEKLNDPTKLLGSIDIVLKKKTRFLAAAKAECQHALGSP